MMAYVNLVIGLVLINNFVLSQILGLCPFIGVSKKTKDSIGMGVAVVFVMTLASVVTLVSDRFILLPLVERRFNAPDLRVVLQTIVFILVIAVLVQFVEMVIQKTAPALYRALGIYLPLITTNCAVLGVALLNVKSFGNTPSFAEALIKSTLQGFFGGAGFMLAMLLMSGIREKLDGAAIPAPMRGAPIAFACAAMMAMAFMGFAGFKL